MATQAQADATLEVLLEYGVNHIDTAPYNQGVRLLDRAQSDADQRGLDSSGYQGV